jgi:hypothetical protein
LAAARVSLGKGAHGLASQIAGAQDARILEPQLAQAAVEASHQRVHRRDVVGLGGDRQVGIVGQWFDRPRAACPIDQRDARDLEQPGTRVVEGAEVPALPHRLQKDVVQQVGRRVGVRQTVPRCRSVASRISRRSCSLIRMAQISRSHGRPGRV